MLFVRACTAHRHLHSFPTRRSSDLPELYVADRSNHRIQVYDVEGAFKRVVGADFLSSPSAFARDGDLLIVAELRARLDRKSTRLNSSHVSISYAVFCLKKKNKNA